MQAQRVMTAQTPLNLPPPHTMTAFVFGNRRGAAKRLSNMEENAFLDHTNDDLTVF
jgi:hypothetical protein